MESVQPSLLWLKVLKYLVLLSQVDSKVEGVQAPGIGRLLTTFYNTCALNDITDEVEASISLGRVSSALGKPQKSKEVFKT